ncbi:unnamed protein product [Hymenolepis diminuta]|uniref:DHC_N1 domain-containing protein n=1 Tax=Hymenolepis diminuta TaxID=6216 RepID=A0A0R3SWZ6_HYMDI|nr:unnamed protein product [Hymenolepis diminuta]VUZ55610.1 unnamed protein product [Hymenolepis diminuta]
MSEESKYNLALDYAVIKEYLLMLLQFTQVSEKYWLFMRNHPGYSFEEFNSRCNELKELIRCIQQMIYIVEELFIELRHVNEILSSFSDTALNYYEDRFPFLKNKIEATEKWLEILEQLQNHRGNSVMSLDGKQEH